MTAEKDTLLKISQDYLDFTNTVSGMEEAAADDAYASVSSADRMRMSTMHR